jgi:hypothetical protein
MVVSLSSHSVVIHFFLTTVKKEQEQPVLLQSTTPKQKSSFASFKHQSYNFQWVSLLNSLVCSHSIFKLIFVDCSET